MLLLSCESFSCLVAVLSPLNAEFCAASTSLPTTVPFFSVVRSYIFSGQASLSSPTQV